MEHERKKAIKELNEAETFIVSTVVWKNGTAEITTIIAGSKHGLSYAKEGIELKLKTL